MISKVVFLLEKLIVATEKGNIKENMYTFCSNNQKLSVLISSLPAPALTNIHCKVSSVAKTCFYQKGRIILKHKTFLRKNYEINVVAATEG